MPYYYVIIVTTYLLVGFGLYDLMPFFEPGKPKWHAVIVIVLWLPIQIIAGCGYLRAWLVNQVIDWKQYIKWEWLER